MQVLLKQFLFFGFSFGIFCSYAQENVSFLSELPDELSESSGLIFFNGKLITHNDSGNLPVLYEIDTTTFEITRRVRISNIENIDWEDLTQDEQFIYIGDFGNNLGTRTDLSVYKVSKVAFINSDTVSAEKINFRYKDQTDFTNNGNSDWDAEAFFVLNDELVILTKQWKSFGTSAYVLSKNGGEQVAQKIDDYQVNGLITGASYNIETKSLFIIGYSTILRPFLIEIENSRNTSIFTDMQTKYSLNIGSAQIEGITYTDKDTYYLSSEYFERTNLGIQLNAQLFKFKVPQKGTGEMEENGTENGGGVEQNITEIRLYQPNVNQLVYELNTVDVLIARAIHDATGKQLRYLLKDEMVENIIDISTFHNAIYYLTFYFENRTESIPFIKF